ncbi:Protein BRICK1 [Plasmodiophora brassicae]|uniref:Protein BRICK1 n=1 Tax=Plasmodiophora brassicae TaxID=37360 RepID=A0A0G4IUL5_PLABS|nr:hypothetical protein PBRA_006900 [Plasmodiophora brassicae]SPR00587.1 unnamed protein product [Plasmodiophora brassicae]
MGTEDSGDGDHYEVNDAVQADWQQREFVEMLKMNMVKIVAVLNRFDASARERLSKINDRIGTLERNIEYLEVLLGSDKGQ